jgi:hypothetical protein
MVKKYAVSSEVIEGIKVGKREMDKSMCLES